jgi:hypothetical protein
MKRCFITFHFTTFNLAPDLIAIYPGADPGRGRIQGGAQPAPPPLKLEKNMIFHTKYLKNVRASSARRSFFKCTP